jgi:hypothetical protein
MVVVGVLLMSPGLVAWVEVTIPGLMFDLPLGLVPVLSPPLLSAPPPRLHPLCRLEDADDDDDDDDNAPVAPAAPAVALIPPVESVAPALALLAPVPLLMPVADEFEAEVAVGEGVGINHKQTSRIASSKRLSDKRNA